MVTAAAAFFAAAACPSGIPDPKNDSTAKERDEDATIPGEATCWVPAAPMTYGRHRPAGAVLADGRILVVGGSGVNSAEIFDPVTMTWSLAAPPLMDRTRASAVTLRDGRVLLSGGIHGIYPKPSRTVAEVEIYDPVANSWSFAAPMLRKRVAHSSVLLSNGDVLVVGTYGNERESDTPPLAAQVYRVEANEWVPAQMPLPPGAEIPHAWAAALGDEAYVVVPDIRDVFAFRPGVGWRLAGTRSGTTGTGLVPMPEGSLLLPAGVDAAAVERSDSSAMTWQPGPSLRRRRAFAGVASLRDGTVVVVGGRSQNPEDSADPPTFADAEVLFPGAGEWRPAGRRPLPGERSLVFVLDDHRIMAVGGYSGFIVMNQEVDILDIRDVTAGCADAK